MKQKLRIGLAWQTVFTDNLGVAALSEANIWLIKSAAKEVNVELDFIEFCPQASGIYKEVSFIEKADSISFKQILLGKSAYLKQIKECDLIIDIGQGDSFSDIYGLKRFIYLAFSKIACGLFRVPLILAPQTIGPFESNLSSFLALLCFKFSSVVLPRDNMSYERAISLSNKSNIKQSCDVAFYLPYNEDEFQHLSQNKKIGLNVSGLLYNGGYEGNNQFGLKLNYRDLIDKILFKLVSEYDFEIHLVGHVNSDKYLVEDDYRVVQSLAKKYKGVKVAPRFETPSEAKSYISKMNFFSGARMHSCIAAFSSGVPVLPMAYSRKFNGLFGSLNYNYILDLKAVDIDEGVGLFFQSLDELVEMKSAVTQGNLLAKDRLEIYKKALVSEFERVSRG